MTTYYINSRFVIIIVDNTITQKSDSLVLDFTITVDLRDGQLTATLRYQ